MRIVRAQPEDLEDIVRLNRQFVTIFRKKGRDPPRYANGAYDIKDVTRERIEGNLLKDRYFLAKEDGYTLGAMSLWLPAYRCKTTSEIATLAVRLGMQRKGIGTRLVDHAIKRSKTAGMRHLIVASYCIYDAKKFYLNAGFRFSGMSRNGRCRSYYFCMDL
ncbi:GNAT family N-acetyltransferase [Candidatus Woesearchaeota archaeon]|nr:GNAT family N-acetyltransferase [Candidatus Woesearchaeota archaeon]